MTTPPGLAAEDAAVYGYGLVLAGADAGIRAAVRRELAAHRARRDAAERLWPGAAPAPVGYLTAPDVSTSPVLLAIRLESDCCEAWRGGGGGGGNPPGRRFFLAGPNPAPVATARRAAFSPGG
uniref:DUF4439 domain-containing protein n=1 Tax=uncultured Dietzia sp. TaxID=395519 RepID=UPI00260C4A7E